MIKPISISTLLFFLGACFVISGSCSGHHERVDVVELSGAYWFHTFGRDVKSDSLVLFPDSTFNQVYRTDEGHSYFNSGKWLFRGSSSEVVFTNFKFFTNDGASPGSGNWFCTVLKENGEIRLIFSKENAEYYRQIPNNR